MQASGFSSSRVLVGLLVGAGLLMFHGTAFGRDLYVGPGQTYTTIQAGIDAAWAGDTVWVENGVYTGAGNQDLDPKGKAITVRSISGASSCIIDLESIADHRGFVMTSGETADTIIQGFTIRNGRVTGDRDGGGIKIIGSSPSIRECVIEDCHAGDNGGGIFINDSAAPAIDGCTIIDNDANGAGGGVAIRNGSTPMLRGCSILRNTSGGNGGNVWVKEGSSPSFLGCEIRYGATLNGGTGGGGIHIKGGGSVSYFLGCFIAVNVAQADGGGIRIVGGSAFLENCVINGNAAGSDGGGVSVEEGASLYLSGCTLNLNQAIYHGGGVALRGGSATVMTARNSILWGNIDDYAGGWDPNQIYLINSPVTDVAYCFVQDGWPGYLNRTSDPLLLVDGYHISSSSPCINGGDNGFANWTEDIDGEPRLQGLIVDVGADEVR